MNKNKAIECIREFEYKLARFKLTSAATILDGLDDSKEAEAYFNGYVKDVNKKMKELKVAYNDLVTSSMSNFEIPEKEEEEKNKKSSWVSKLWY